jgi:hypothetical protein
MLTLSSLPSCCARAPPHAQTNMLTMSSSPSCCARAPRAQAVRAACAARGARRGRRPGACARASLQQPCLACGRALPGQDGLKARRARRPTGTGPLRPLDEAGAPGVRQSAGGAFSPSRGLSVQPEAHVGPDKAGPAPARAPRAAPGAHRQHPLLLRPHARAERPARAADAAVEQRAPVLGAVDCERLHVVLHVQQPAVARAVHDLVQRVGLARRAALAQRDRRERHVPRVEQVALLQRRCGPRGASGRAGRGRRGRRRAGAASARQNGLALVFGHSAVAAAASPTLCVAASAHGLGYRCRRAVRPAPGAQLGAAARCVFNSPDVPCR